MDDILIVCLYFPIAALLNGALLFVGVKVLNPDSSENTVWRALGFGALMTFFHLGPSTLGVMAVAGVVTLMAVTYDLGLGSIFLVVGVVWAADFGLRALLSHAAGA